MHELKVLEHRICQRQQAAEATRLDQAIATYKDVYKSTGLYFHYDETPEHYVLSLVTSAGTLKAEYTQKITKRV